MHTERRKVIKEMLESKPFVSLKELFAQFPGVSGMTIRRDIDFFEKQGVAIKVRGGARSMKFITTTMEDKFPNRMMKNRRSKELLAKKAMDYLEPGRSIFLDSGTTMLTMSSMLTNERLTITTTGPNIALELLNKPNVIVNIIGGMVTRDNISVTGTLALKFLNAINIDTAFIVPSGVSASAGLSCGNFSECETKKLIVEKARLVVALIDENKLDRNLPYSFCGIEDVDVLITSTALPSELESKARSAGVKIIHA